MDLAGACAIVTGGASGIGAACVAQLQRRGARVAVLDLHDAPAADVSLAVDVGDEGRGRRRGGRRGRRSSAGSTSRSSTRASAAVRPILDLTTDEWDRVMSVNLRGAFVTLRECARDGRDAAAGRDRRDHERVGVPHRSAMAHYSVSKAGLAQLVRVAARELGPHGIRVNGVAPGTTDTPMFAATDGCPGTASGCAEQRGARPRRHGATKSRRRSSRCARSTG